jgi:predicted Rossmann fold nucleotide-binding protein DprA/Smf involved in DNA uptake
MNEGKVLKVVSGGQTGVDRAALDVALDDKIGCGGWCPKGRIAEDGIIDRKYPLKETDSEDYAVRTEQNVIDSDGTLILNRGGLSSGTALTVEYAKKYKKPCLIIDLDKCEENISSFGNVLIVRGWIMVNDIKVLNVAGPRESKSQGIYELAKKFLQKLFGV